MTTITRESIETAIRNAGVADLRSAERRAIASEALRPLLFDGGWMPVANPRCAPRAELTSVGRYARWAANFIATAQARASR